MSGHVDAESLALYAEGQLSRRRTARVRAHLSGCADCAGTFAALTEVTSQLSHVPALPMPSAVAARLDAALSAESARRAAGPAPAPAGPPPQPPRRNPRWSPAALRILAGTAVTLVVAGGIGYALSQVSGSSGPSSSRSGATAPAPQRQHRSTIQGGPNLSPGSTGGHHSLPNHGMPSTPAYVASGTDYRDATLAAQAKHQLGEHVPAASVSTQVHYCVRKTADGRPVRLVDLAHYQHQPAIVIVLGNPDTVTAVSYSCTTLQTALLP
jgi:hypothetical protein